MVSGYTKHTEGDKELYDVTYKTPDIFPIVSCSLHLLYMLSDKSLQFKFAENPSTRQRAQEGHESRLELNVPLLSKALDLRRRIAKLLGYQTWSVATSECIFVV